MELKEQIIHFCQLYGIRLDKEKGQNFIINENIYTKEIELVNLSSKDVVLDIGAGFGFLTERIAEIAKKVYAIEIDETISKVFSKRLKEFIELGKIELVLGDALKIPFPKDVNKIVSNPPYSISSPLVVKIIKEFFGNEKFEKGVLILQKEFVEKLLSKPCSKNWSRLSAFFNYYAIGRFGGIVSKKNFFPRPDVDSAFLLFEFKRESFGKIFNVDFFEALTKIVFKGPNKKVRRVLKSYLKANAVNWRDILRRISNLVDLDKRVRCLNLVDLEKIGKVLLDSHLIFETRQME